jgi:hypothetical protein
MKCDRVKANWCEDEKREWDNCAREVLRLLPEHLTTRITTQVKDARLVKAWMSFARDNLHDVVREALADVTTSRT